MSGSHADRGDGTGAGAAQASQARPAAGSAPAAPSSYYGRPIIKEPVWTREIPWYLFLGGLGGASAAFAYACELRRCEALARRSWAVALCALGASPVLLISDLGRPERALNMLRMFKLTSPMSVGSWILAAGGASTGLSALSTLTGRARWLARAGKPIAALLGLPVATYTAALLAQTAVPAWCEARRELPAVFAAGSAMSAGAAAVAVTPVVHAAPARRLALLGAAAELAAISAMSRRLGELGEPYREGAPARYARGARTLSAAGSALMALRAGRSRPAAVASSAMLLAAAACERWSVFSAGFASSRDPRYTVAPQRARAEAGAGQGASKRVAKRPA